MPIIKNKIIRMLDIIVISYSSSGSSITNNTIIIIYSNIFN